MGRHFDLRHAQRLEKLLEEHLSGVGGRSIRGQHGRCSSVIISTSNVEGVLALDPEDDAVLAR